MGVGDTGPEFGATQLVSPARRCAGSQASPPQGPGMVSQYERAPGCWHQTHLGERSGEAREETRIGFARSQEHGPGRFLDL